MEKKQYEKPEVTKVAFKFDEAIAASTCWDEPSRASAVPFADPDCLN